jgi:type VI secretion system protein VasJ
MPLSPDDIRERVRAWTEPVSPEAPTGLPAKHEPAYELVAQEVARLESPSGAPVNWSRVVTHAGELLRHTTKDLWLASYLAYGLHATEGLQGAATGTTVLTELLDRYWDTMYPEPKRLRGRVNAVSWFAERMAAVLPSVQVAEGDREAVESLSERLQRLAELTRTRFEEQAPAFGPLLEGLERLRSRLPPARAGSAPASTPEPRPPALAPEPPPPPASLAPPPGQLASPDAVTEFLRGLGTSLLDSVRMLRKACPTEPLAYRLLRVGLWLHLTRAPPAGPEGRTAVPPLPASLRARLEQLEANARWGELLEESESALEQHRFVLDLQRHSAAALAGLGPAYAPAREALRLELAAMLERMPGVVELCAADQSPFADKRTREWLESEILERPAPLAPMPRLDAAPEEAPEQGLPPLPAEARALLAASKVAEALSLLQREVAAAPNGRSRFKARLALARACVLSGQDMLARALYETLAAESTTRGLDDWEPALAAECLEGALLSTRIVQKHTGEDSRERWNHYRRLTNLDPSASLRLGR